MAIRLFTIGFTGKSAEQFFRLLREARVQRMLDIRLNNVSQLAGFTKRKDLQFFLRAICNVGYYHLPECAPTKDILDKYKKKKGDWQEYEMSFLALIAARKIETVLTPELLDRACLLCSEPTPEKCHRRLVASYMAARMPDLEVIHL